MLLLGRRCGQGTVRALATLAVAARPPLVHNIEPLPAGIIGGERTVLAMRGAFFRKGGTTGPVVSRRQRAARVPDEAGELPLSIQAAAAHAAERRDPAPWGRPARQGERCVIMATNRSLRASMCATDRFVRTCTHRLSVRI